MGKKAHIKVMIITLAVFLLATAIVFIARKSTQTSTLIDDDQNIAATQHVVLPDGNHVLATPTEPARPGKIGAVLTELTPAVKSNLQYPQSNGVYIQDTYLDSPAQIAGLLPGDVLVNINNVETQDLLPSLELIAQLKPGSAYPFTVFRAGKYLNYTITISDKVSYHG